MSIKDIIKNSVYEQLGMGVGLRFREIAFIILISCLIGMYIYYVYKNCSKSQFYSKDINITIAGLPVIVAAIMIAMQSNLLVSLGMVGALSIVRFRTAIKNPVDLLFLFWAISCGIISGVNLHIISIILCIIMTLLILLFNLLPAKKRNALLVIRTCKDARPGDIKSTIANHVKSISEKSIIIQNNEIELYYVIRVNDTNDLVSLLGNNKDIISVSIMTEDSEVRI